MTLMDRIKGALGGDTGTELTFRYHCHECEAEFETTESMASKVVCPECGASGTRALSKL